MYTEFNFANSKYRVPASLPPDLENHDRAKWVRPKIEICIQGKWQPARSPEAGLVKRALKCYPKEAQS